MKLIFRSALLLLILYAMVFAIGDAYLARHGAPLWVALAFAVGIVGLQYWAGPYLIQWFLKIRWDDTHTELPVRNLEFLQRLCAARGLQMPRIGIIQSATPNAFTFGHVPCDARVVVTTGLLKILTTEESNAVLAHEMGHVEHYDFIVMTLASLAPLLLYQLYVFTRSSNKTRAVALGAYVCYWVSQYVALMLSRTREYFADEYSAQATGTPDALATGLVKIAYGIFQADGQLAEALETCTDGEAVGLRRERSRVRALAMMGISNVSAGQSLALSGADCAGAAAIMRWDLVNPWARLYELASTHPLTALRIRAMNRESEARHQTVSHPLPLDSHVRWATFPMEAALWAAPWVCGVATVVAALINRALGSWDSVGQWFAAHGVALSPSLPAALMLLTGVTWALRTWLRYYGSFQPATIADLMTDVDVSQMRTRAVRLEGTMVGFGVPGAFWCADLVLRDPTGMLFVLYKQTIPLARLMFAITTASGYIGQKVMIEGWFRRGLRPYIEMACLTGEDGKTHVTWSRWVHHGVASLLMVGGALWLAVSR